MRWRLHILFLIFALAASAIAQDMTPQDKADRVTAFALYDQRRYLDALPLLSVLATRYPKDIPIHEAYGFCLLSSEATAFDVETRKSIRKKVRSVLLEAQALGDNSNLLNILLELPEEPTQSFSANPIAEAAMRSAEADYARGNLEHAIDEYKMALAADPTLYYAALFIGDSYFKFNKFDEAGPWFAKAIAINPDVETAYRYWGDTLVAAGQPEEARAKFIDALVAEPYTVRAQTGMKQFLDHYKLSFQAPALKEQAAFSPGKKKGDVTITIDSSAPKGSESAAWLAYALSRALWQGEKFKQNFPKEPKYRHTLKEETESLTNMLSVLEEINTGKDKKKSDAKPIDPSLVELARIQKAGFLEPYILLFHSDQDIIQDYIPYRTTHRAEIRRYLDEFAVPTVPPVTKPPAAK